jgi:hypothetical protein
MPAIGLTTLPPNGQHLTVFKAVDSRKSRSRINWKVTGMAERVI